ncbi:hypothetical protein K3888_10405 [Dietzia aurantiaca]|nr:hypothetical protein [Dietzia aurantiaca]MCD2263113.1 hypothetical protein [Dietzia aurantiaca]
MVTVAMAAGHLLEQRSRLSLKRLFRVLKWYRPFELTIAGQPVHAASPLPPEIAKLIAQLEA